ncbi:unnamed protein product [Polarella glacialis]|uniref:Uncharacterized protein n=1 Tax=Polarella glacialis TaxID=89957 RepID=A0A813JGC0_POLGL|nr:unnamed protein product [Polarella glacialis]
MAEEEGDQGDTELVTLDVEKPLFYHGPRLPGFGAEIAGVQSLATLCYSAAYDLVFTAKDTEVLAYCGQELVRSLSTDGKASEPRCRLGRGGGPVTFLSTSGEGTDGSLRDCGLLCVASAGGRLCFYSLEEADNGRAKEVYSTTLENEEVVELRWRLDDVLCVCDGGRTFLVQPLASSVACVHDVVEFTPCCVGVDPRSDIALLGGTPPANDDTCANLWALDLGTSESWPLFIEGIPQESEDHLGYATLRGIRMLGSHGSDANGGVSAACLFVVEDGDNGPLTLQVIVSISADWRKATLKALSINELFMEDFADQVIMHSVWVPEWSMLMMGISASADIVLISSDSKEDLGPCGWVALAPPEGKKLGCPNTVAQDATTSLRGLCLVTSFKGEVPRKGGSADAQKLVSPPVVLLAASDGSLSVHYCDHHLPTPKDTPKPKAGSSPSVMRSSSAVPAASPFAGSGGLASPSPFGSAVGVSASPFGSAVGVSASPFGSAAGGSTFASPFAGSLSGSPFASAAGASGGASASGPLFGGTQVSSPFGVGGSTAGVSTSLSAGPFAAQSMASSPCAPGAAGVSSNTSTSASPFAPAAGSAKQAEAPSGAVGATKPLTSLGVQNIAQSSESPQKDWCRENITKVYREHNPSKLEEIDNLMKKYGGKEVELYEKVCKKYSVTALKYSDSSVANQVQSSAGSAGSSPGSLFGGAAAASAGASTGSPFGGDAAPAGSSSGSLFGSSTGGLAGPSLFGGVASAGSGSLFGGAAAVASAGAAPGSLFGGAAASAGAPSGSLFGGDAAPAGSSSGSLFGSSTGGLAGPSLFGGVASAGSGSLFGGAAAVVSAGAASGSLFGGVAASAGASSGSLFGGDAAPAGSSSGSLFGSSTGGLAGPSLFGGVASAGSGSLFGGAAAVASAGAASGSLFGGAAAASAGASSGSPFGGDAAPAGSSSGSLFGSSTGGLAGPSLFGGVASAGSGSLFGGAAAVASAGAAPGSLFGGAAASAGASSGSLFGGDAAPAGSSSGSLFGSSTGGLAGPSLFGGVASAGSGSLFGGAAAVASAGAAPGSLFGGVAASAGASSGSLFGGAAAVSAGAASGSLFGGVAAATGSSPGSLSSAAVTSGISDPATQSSERDWCQEQITQVYKEHNASKLTEVEALLAKHVGKEMQLYERVCKKYGIAASQFPGATVGGTTAVVAAPAGVIAESTPATGLFGSAAGSSSLFGGTGTKVSDAAGGLFGEVPALGSLGLSGLGLGDGLGKKPASSETVSAFTGASPPPASKLLAGGPKDDGLQGRQAATKKLLTALRAPSKDSAFAPLFPACEALEKELAQMESEEVVSPNAGKNWGDFSQQVAAAETNSAAISADLKKMDCLKTPQVFSELAELQSRTLQHYSRFISEGPASQHQGSEGPRLTAIRARCAEIQEELVSLEQELLEKFRNKIDLREDDLNVSAGSYFEPSSRLSGPAFEESSLGGLLSANSCRRPTRFGYGSRTCGSFGNRSTPAARNPLRAPRTGGQEATLGEMVNGGGAVMKHSSSSRPCLQQPGQDGDDRRWFLQSRAEQEQQRSRELNERALDLAERASEAAKAVAASSVKLPGGGSSSSSSLGTGAATASSIAAASCQGPVRRLRASLYSQLTSLASRAPRRRVKRSDHLALDRGALEMCGEANTQSEIDTPTFGSRSDFFSGLGSSNHGSGNGEPFGKRSASGADDEKLLMPPPTGLPSKSKGSPRLGFGTSEPTLPSTSGAGLDFGSASSASSSSGGLFGGGKGGLFGASEGGLFGASSAASGSSLFGASSTAASSSGAEAGSSSSSSSSALGGLFAASPQTAVSASSSASFGSLFGSSAPSAPAAQQVDVKQAYKERMLKIYQQHNPSKVDEIDALMAKYVGQEHVMYSKICIKYKVQPEPEIKAGAVEVAPLAATAGAAPAAATAAPAAGGMFGAPAAGGAFGAPAAGGMFGAPAAAPQAAPSSSAGFGASSLFGASAGASAAPAAAASLFGGAAAPAAVIPDVKQAYKDRMVRIYQQHNPGKVGEIDSLMAKYVGQEHVMYLKICAKYKVQPEVEIKAGAAAAAAPAAGGLFGAPAAAAPAFGSAPSGGGGLFGAAPCGGGASLFGAPSAAAPQTGGPFGAPASSGGAFGAPAAGGMFGAPAAGGTFGAPAAGGAFGAPAAGGMFGAPAAGGAFGAPAAGGMFGAPAAAPAAGGMFGQAAAASPFGGAVQSSPFGASAPAAGVPGLLDECRARVNAIYQQFNPGKLGEVETLLAKYRGKEQELYFKVCKKYNINPPPPLASAAAAPQAPVGGGGFFGAQAAPAPSAFGGGGGFGQPQAPGGAFGAPAAAGQGFGGSPFGAPAVGGAFGGASASPFGGGAAPAFGAPSGLLGGAPAFGSPSQLGGAANPFGRAASSSPSPFGGGMGGGGFASLSQQPGSFGSSPFGAAAPATMSPFGAPAAASPFGGGASASPFGGGNQWTSHRG